MVKERHLPLGDARGTKVAPLMKHGTPEEILPVDNGTKNNTPHF